MNQVESGAIKKKKEEEEGEKKARCCCCFERIPDGKKAEKKTLQKPTLFNPCASKQQQQQR